MRLFLNFVVGMAVSLSHLQVGCFWFVLLALLLVLVVGGLLLAVAAGVAVLVLDLGVSDLGAQCWVVCAWFAFLACLFLARCAILILPDSRC